MAILKGKLIPEPKPNTRTILITKEAPTIRGAGDLSVICGKCGTVLIENISKGQISNVVIKCPACGAYNDIISTS